MTVITATAIWPHACTMPLKVYTCCVNARGSLHVPSEPLVRTHGRVSCGQVGPDLMVAIHISWE